MTSRPVFWGVFLFSFSKINSLTEQTKANLPSVIFQSMRVFVQRLSDDVLFSTFIHHWWNLPMGRVIFFFTVKICWGILRSSSNLLQLSSSYVCVFQEIISSLLGLMETNMPKSSSDTVSVASSSSGLLRFSFSKADFFTGWTFSCLSLIHE